MAATVDLRPVLDFLIGLRDNNDRGWFEDNRPSYIDARAAFEALVGELIYRFDTVDDLGGVSPRECIFRINRDLRFSKDKTPYKTAMSALLGRRGRKSALPSYYLHIEPEGKSMLAGGLWEPESSELGKIRQALADDAKSFKKIIAAPAFVRHFGGLSGDSLKTAPMGYPKDHPEIELLRRKQFMAIETLDDETVATAELVPLALDSFRAMRPLLDYLGSELE
jgi:uncharacterized protein (TIGR02453 family)